MSIDPAAELRHELRTPLNHIIGYAELLLEDFQDPAPALAPDLQSLLADGRDLLARLNEVLAQRTGPVDLVSARDTLGPRVTRIRAAVTRLREGAAAAGVETVRPDLDRIGNAVERLERILRHGGVPPPEEGRAGRPGRARHPRRASG